MGKYEEYIRETKEKQPRATHARKKIKYNLKKLKAPKGYPCKKIKLIITNVSWMKKRFSIFSVLNVQEWKKDF